MSDEEQKRLNWTPAEWTRVAVNMLPLLERGETRMAALGKAQRKALARARHHDDTWIQRHSAPAAIYLNKYLDIVRKMTPEEREPHVVLTPAEAYAKANPDAPKPPRNTTAGNKLSPKGADEGRDYTGARWTTKEWALIARMVNWFRTHGVPHATSRLVIEAQELVLERDRRRSLGGIQASVNGGRLEKNLAEAQNNIWLVKDIPFNPPHPEGSDTTDAAAVDNQTTPPAEQGQQATETAIPAANVEATGETTAQGLPPVAAGSLREAMTGAVADFGTTLRNAMDKLLLAHSAIVLHHIEGRMMEAASRTAQEVASMIQTELHKSVHAMVEAELGGPVTPPPPLQPAPPAQDTKPADAPLHDPSPTPVAFKPKNCKVDVIGLRQDDVNTVRRSFIGQPVDLRFFDSDARNEYKARDNSEVIMIRSRIPHTLTHKVEAAGIRPIYVDRSTGHVMHAIEELLRAHGIAQAQHLQ